MIEKDNDIQRNEASYIREIQEYLRHIAAQDDRVPLITVDGIYGPETAQAVRRFQELYGLPVTGRVNRETWVAIYAQYLQTLRQTTVPEGVQIFPKGDYALKAGMENELVVIVQLLLNTLNRRFYNVPAVQVNGTFDPQTQQAVKEFQKLIDEEPTGEVNRRTWEMLTLLYNRLLAESLK